MTADARRTEPLRPDLDRSACRAAARRAPTPTAAASRASSPSPRSSARRCSRSSTPGCRRCPTPRSRASRDRLADARHDARGQRRHRHDGADGVRLPLGAAARRDAPSASASPGALRRPQRLRARSGTSSTPASARCSASGARAPTTRAIALGIENHQDFTSAELVAFCEAYRGVGITFDTGNTFPVAEAPLDFTRRVAPHVVHIHLKDYRVQFTDEGYRLVRCAIGDGAVPLARDAAHRSRPPTRGRPRCWSPARWRRGTSGSSRPDWWNGYAPKTRARSSRPACARRSVNRLPDGRRLPHPLGARGGRRAGGLRARHDPAQRREHAGARDHAIGEDHGEELTRQDRLRHRLGPRPRPGDGRAAGRARRRTWRSTTSTGRSRRSTASSPTSTRWPSCIGRHGAQGRRRHRQHRRPRRRWRR